MSRRSILRDLSQAAIDRARHLAADESDQIGVAAYDAVRLAILAAGEPIEETAEDDEGEWMRIDLFGHTTVHGHVREVVYAGQRWLEVHEPEILAEDGSYPEYLPERITRYHPNAVYSMFPLSEETAIKEQRRARGFPPAVEPDPAEDIPF